MEDTSDTLSADPGAAFLLVQLGFYGAHLFERRLVPLGIEPRHFGLLRAVAATEGQSQQALAEALHIPKSRMVWLVDDLEGHELVERRRNPTDRRANALYLTPKGHDILKQGTEAAHAHERELLRALQPAERNKLTAFLQRVATDQGLVRTGLAGFLPSARPTNEDPD